MFNWKEDFSCDIASIDTQHKKLFELANELYNLLSLKDEYDRYDDILNTLSELQKYTVYHFGYEEDLMKSVNYPNFECHKKQHDNFVKKVTNIDKAYIDENQKEVLRDLLLFIVDWIEGHILKIDMQYKELFKERCIK
ncbi:hemerythrin [Clostridium tetani]|uniref:Hemerythrin n=1 Tax=Clostridium tetani TaxID=1513 RepID=A0A4Q0VD59_CLOTA|nr:hemerythrin family protein [Clostridium tetani]RXI48920.1 bacteriohemerythrin [Clostridium tetani]RXI53582.1 bacteriohemerythrin [Clostridium tetani]RXI55584.1 bacteriohemerythrin [Clostridium tetani]BDR68101.1 hemerythrin [Clostridium tetani]BDR73581.1 hemerythrin [Clostridium tetani]